uniref:Apple domain-containing protein n=1 Tax=Syphacia muris TaxID=451379 RepID=A0A0N5AT40_9BILA
MHVKSQGQRTKRDHIDLNSCFKLRKGYKLDLKPNEYEDAERTVEFKDDCLRACLRASLSERSERGFVCRSLIFAPKQSDCLLTAVSADERAVRSDEKNSPVRLYENVCVKPPFEGGTVEARLRGYRGGEGLIQIVQKKGQKALAYIVVDGMKQNADYDILFSDDNSRNCIRISSVEKKKARKLVTVDTDTTGMGVQPWSEINLDVLNNDILNKTIIAMERKSGDVIICGSIGIKGNRTEWENAKNVSTTSISFWLPLLLMCSFLHLFLQHKFPL